jgi:hypothetical protein
MTRESYTRCQIQCIRSVKEVPTLRGVESERPSARCRSNISSGLTLEFADSRKLPYGHKEFDRLCTGSYCS